MHLSAEIIERKNELLLALRREMNGAVAGSMRDGGIEYGLNFGVSVPTIRSVASRYAGDDELASEVWKSGVRELRLAGLFIATPELLAEEAWSGYLRGGRELCVVALALRGGTAQCRGTPCGE